MLNEFSEQSPLNLSTEILTSLYAYLSTGEDDKMKEKISSLSLSQLRGIIDYLQEIILQGMCYEELSGDYINARKTIQNAQDLKALCESLLKEKSKNSIGTVMWDLCRWVRNIIDKLTETLG